MVRLETGYTPLSEVVKENLPSPDTQKNPPHGVEPKTYSFLLAAIDYNNNVKNIFDKIDPTTRNLVGIYYGCEVSITEVATLADLTRNTAKNRILKGLGTIWEQLPSNIQESSPKEEVIKMKDPTIILKETHTKIAKTLWQNPDYRKKTMEGIRRKSRDPKFIQRMEDINPRRPSPMEGKKHKPETIQKLREGTQNSWVVRRFLKDMDITQRTDEEKKLYEDTIRITRPTINQAISFLNELQQNPYNMVHRSVSEREIKKIALSMITDIQDIFSSSSADEIREKATKLEERLETVKNQLSKKKTGISAIDAAIGKDERSMWQQIKEKKLETGILQTGQITQEELNMIRDYFEKKIIREGLTIRIFNKFTIAATKVNL